jgi:predicted nucleic acid-binding Zn ribbon protein
MACPKCGKETLADWILCPECTKIKKATKKEVPDAVPIFPAKVLHTESTPALSPEDGICPTCHRPFVPDQALSSMTADKSSTSPTKRRFRLLPYLIVIMIGLLIYTQLGIFFVNPTNQNPRGSMLIVLRGGDEPFFDSSNTTHKKLGPDNDVTNRPNYGVLLKLPYVDSLYEFTIAHK